MLSIVNTRTRSNTRSYLIRWSMKSHDGIYLDYNATTPCDPQVVEKMLPYFGEVYGNPSNGLHAQGRLAEKAVEAAREQVAQLIGAQSKEIFFTGGATESNNIVIAGLAKISGGRRKIITSVVEHKAVLLPCKNLELLGFEIVILPVSDQGKISVDALVNAIDKDTLLVSIQAANNEMGTIQPIEEITDIAHKAGALVHSDAAQAVGKIPVD